MSKTSCVIIVAVCVAIEHAVRFLLRDFIKFTNNLGAAFSLFPDSPGVLLGLSFVAFGTVFFLSIFSYERPVAQFGLALMSGGALSNLLERFFLGYVIDWIESPFSFIDVNFNLADVEIALGALIVLIGVMRSRES